MSVRQLGLGTQCLFAVDFRLVEPLRASIGFIPLPVRLAQSCVSRSVIWAQLQRLLKLLDRAVNVFRLLIVQQIPATTHVVFVGGGFGSMDFRRWRLLGPSVLRQHGEYVGNGVILQGEK